MKMKSIVRLLVIAAGVTAVWLAADQCRSAVLRKQLEEELVKPEGADKPVGMPNPVKKLRIEEYCSQSGLGMCPEDLAGCKAYRINTEPVLYGLKLRDSDELEYDFRSMEKGGSEDISDMYYEWTTTVGHPSEAPECKVYLNDHGQGVCSWEDEERIYSISMTEGASLVKLVWMRERLLSLMNKQV